MSLRKNGWVPVLCWVLVIFFLSHQPKANLAPAQPSALIGQSQLSWSIFSYLDWDTLVGKMAHIIIYAILAFLLWRVSHKWQIVLVWVFIIGVSDEIHQLFVVGRTGRILDVVIDLGGALLTLWLLWLLSLWRNWGAVTDKSEIIKATSRQALKHESSEVM
ncbi:MAG: VanZ family protein [Chloroflexota bacterium]